MRHLGLALGTTLALTGLCSTALAQDLEPNSCADALEQTLTLPSIHAGNIDLEDPVSLRTDLDYFRFTADPGLALTASNRGIVTGEGVFSTIFETVLGVYDEECNLIASTGDAPVDVVDFSVPESGVFHIAIGERSDRALDGNGGSERGLYAFGLGPQTPRIGSFSGRVVDGFTGAPLDGLDAPTARVSLQKCVGNDCRVVARQSTDLLGEFSFDVDVDERSLPAGLLVLTVTADGYDTITRTQLVREGDAPALGDVTIQKPQHLE